MTFAEFIDKFIVPLLPVIVASGFGIPGVVALVRMIKKEKVENAVASANAKKIEADAAKVWQDVAHGAGEDIREARSEVNTKNTRIDQLENIVKDLQREMEIFKLEKLQLEKEKLAQDAEIATLRGRINVLEDLLRENHILIPNGN